MFSKAAPACAIIVAGGVGSRALATLDGGVDTASLLPKQFHLLGGKPIIAWSIEAFARHPAFIATIVVCAPQYRDMISQMVAPYRLVFADAGTTRTASVRSGLEAAEPFKAESVFIHDAARPGLDTTTLDQLLDKLSLGYDGAVPALALADALWSTQGETLDHLEDRSKFLRVQTPQAFLSSKIQAAYSQLAPNDELADDVAVARLAALQVVTVKGTHKLDKVTYPQDFAQMESLLVPTLFPRTGSGIDAHKFSAGDYVTLCGVSIPHSHGLAGHSDADVGWHALSDAIYGALSAGDIGHHFPPSDNRWKGAPSSIFLRHAGDMVVASGGKINHVDVTLVCEAPKIGPNRAAMIEATAALLGLRMDQVSIKATTTEGMGFTGRREGIAAQATVTILLPETFRSAAKVEPRL